MIRLAQDAALLPIALCACLADPAPIEDGGGTTTVAASSSETSVSASTSSAGGSSDASTESSGQAQTGSSGVDASSDAGSTGEVGPGRGQVFVLSGPASSTASASFGPLECPPVEDLTPACKRHMCLPPALPFPEASTVTIDNLGPGGLTPFELVPDGEGVYAAVVLGGPYFAPGDALRFSALGGSVPAFEHDVFAPPSLELEAPLFDGSLVLPADGPSQWTWSGIPADGVDAYLAWILFAGQGTVVCTFEDMTEVAIGPDVPAAVGGMGQVTVYVESRVDVDVPPWGIVRLSAQGFARQAGVTVAGITFSQG